MARDVIHTDKAPKAIGPYSQAIASGGSIFTSGQIPLDPATGEMRSWTFEADGGFGHAVWSRDGKKWSLDSAGILGDGTILTATNIMTPIDDQSFTWQSTNRTVGGEEMPDVAPIKVTRVKAEK